MNKRYYAVHAGQSSFRRKPESSAARLRGKNILARRRSPLDPVLQRDDVLAAL
jgi:hypothetical protein